MPACTILDYDSDDLHALGYFRHLPLAKLTVTSGQWNVRREISQLVAMCPIVVASAQGLTCLRNQVRCNEELLAYILGLFPALQDLIELGNCQHR